MPSSAFSLPFADSVCFFVARLCYNRAIKTKFGKERHIGVGDNAISQRNMIKQKTIAGVTYLRISDISEITGIGIRTLQRWVRDGELVNFMTCYLSKTGYSYFRLGRPRPGDQLIDGEEFKYKLLNEKGEWI